MLSKIKLQTPKDYFIIIIGGICALYLINPTFGVFELLPDNLPLIENLDEGLAVTGLLSALRYFGYDFTDYFRKKNLPQH